ncbi:MAG: hypothetical protein ABSD89_12235 [Halobacteriota archaeon]
MRDLQWIVASNAAAQAAYDKRTHFTRLWQASPAVQRMAQKEGQMTKATTKRAKRTAKRLFKKQPHTTRQLSLADYNNLPKEN